MHIFRLKNGIFLRGAPALKVVKQALVIAKSKNDVQINHEPRIDPGLRHTDVILAVALLESHHVGVVHQLQPECMGACSLRGLL